MVDTVSIAEPKRARRSVAPTDATAFASSLVETRLGLLLVAGTEHGISFAMFGDDPAELTADLTQFAAGTCVTATASGSAHHDVSRSVHKWANMLGAAVNAATPLPALPLDLHGTPFQRRVWSFLGTIPRGSTLTYADVATGIGHPQAIRAAASACGKNNVAVLVPCHRVIRGDGSLGGYRWGLHRKQALLDLEAGRLATPDTGPSLKRG